MNKDVIRKVYDAMSKEYDMAEDFDTFAQDIQNKDVARRVYDAMYDRYRMEEDFEEFYKDLTFMPSVDGVKTTESGSVVVDEAPKKRITLADTLNASVPGVVNAEYTEAVNEGIEREVPLTQEEKDQRAAMRQRLQEDGTIDRMKESKKEARREKISALGRMMSVAGSPSAFVPNINGGTWDDVQEGSTEYRQNKLLQEKLDVALDMARAGENQDGLRGVENFGLGLWDSATRLSTWDFGYSDIVNNLTLQQIVEKWEADPSSLTATEQKVLEGIGMATAVQELYSDQVGVGYNVGQSLPESAGFMASMALNPASGLGKSLARNAVRTYGRNSIAKNLARIGGDIAETTIMTATTGAGRVAADALERINGSSTYEIGENGVIMYGGQKDQETVGSAVIKAIGANFIENYSEALGEYFDPLLGMSRKVAAGGLRKMNLNKWADALSDVQPSQMTASIRALREKTKFGGIFGEIMEEEIGMALNTLFVGDNQWSDFADLETQLTTVLSCAIMSGTLNGVEQVSSVAARRRMEKNAKNAEQEASYRFPSDRFAPLREAIDQASPEGMVDVLRDVYMSQEYTVGQKRALAEYAAARLQLQYYNASDAKARRQVNKTQQELLDAQEAGLNAQLPQFFNIARAAQFAEDELLEYDGDWNLVDVIRSSMNRPEEMERILGDLPPREAQLVTNYIYSRARMEGAYQGRSNRAEDYVDDFAYALEPAVVTDADGNRTITTAIMGESSVYVLDNNGDLAHIMRPDGSKILVKASELTNITTSSAEEVIDRYRDMYTSEYNAETENAFEHHPKTQTPQVGLQLQSPEGEVVITAVNDNMVEIVPAVYKDGQVQPKEGAEPKTVTVDDAYMWQDSYYQGLDDAAAATASQPTVDNMSSEMTENEGTPTEEIEQSVSEEVTDGQNGKLNVNDKGVSEWYNNIRLSGELDQNDSPYVLAPQGGINFGEITEGRNLPSAPIRLSMGTVENGYIHINRRHGQEIKKAGFNSIEDFVKHVVDNYTRIQEGDSYENKEGGKNDTYLIQLQDGHNNTLFVQLSRDGSYWNVNSAGVFNKKYGNNKKNIWSASEVQNDNSAVVSDGSQSESNADYDSTSNGTPSNLSNPKGSGNVSDAQTNGQENVGEGANIDAGINKTARERVPKDDKGNPIYEQTDADTAWDAIVEETEGDTEMAQRVAADMLEDKKAALAKLQKGKPKKGATVAEKIANEKAHAAAIAQAQNDVAQWEAIVGTENRRREAAMSEADRYAAEMEQKNINEGLAALGEPQSLEEYVLGQLAGGAYKLRWSDKENGTKGFGSHTGLSTEEMKARLSMIDNKNGLTPEEVAHNIVENMDASFGEVDVMDVTNMVIDAVSTHASRRAMLNGMVESRAELIRQQEIAEQEAKDAWYMEQYHATEEELAAYNEYLAEFAEEIYGEDTDYEQRIATFAEIQLGYDNQGTDAGLRSSADQGEGLTSDRDGGRSVGETEQLNQREVLGDAAGVAAPEDQGAGGSVSAQSDDRQSRIDRAVAYYRENVDDSPEAIAAAERDQQRYEADMAEDAAETVETLENGDVRRTNLNSLGEIATVAIERDGNVISVDTYEDGALFERTDYDANGNATKVTRYKDGEIVSEQEYKDGKRKVTANVFEMAEDAQKKRKSKKKSNDKLAAKNHQQEENRSETQGVGNRPQLQDASSYESFVERVAEYLQRSYKGTELSEEVAKIIRDFNKGKTILAHTEQEKELLKMLRVMTNKDIEWLLSELKTKRDSLTNEEERKAYDDAVTLASRYRGRGEHNAVVRALTGANLREKLPLTKIDELFDKYNSDADVAELYRRVRAIAEQIGLDFWFDDNMIDVQAGGFRGADNRVRFNAHMLYSPFVSEQTKASVIVHEILHAVADYAIEAQIDVKLGFTPKVQLSKQILSAANTILNIYNKVVQDNTLLVHEEYDYKSGEMKVVPDYGTISVHEMLSEISNPEFRDKLKQIEYKGRSVWQRIWDAIKSMFTQSSDVTNPTAYDSMAKALDVLINEFSVDAYQKYSGLEESAMKLSADENLRFREKEEPKELIAVHNISEDNLKKVLEAGSFIMPSIAITKADMGHTGFGEISLLFDKSTINPSDRRNKVYGGDAWTPRFPRIGVKLNEKVVSRINKKAYELIEDRRLREIFSLSSEVYPDNIEKVISDYGVEGYYNKEWMKLAYLLDSGKKVKIPTKAKDYGIASEDIVRLAKEKGLSVKEIYEDYDFYKNNPDFVAQVKESRDEARLSSIPEEQRDEMRERMQSRPLSEAAFDSYIRGALEMENDLAHGGLKEIVDRQALRDLIEKKVKTDNAEYNKWVDNLFEGIVEKRGIRNNRDWYTPSGNLRPWGQLYDPATPANILKYMLAENEQGGSGGLFDSNIMGASAETYESIEEIREKGKQRLKKLPYEEYDEWSNSVAERMAKICDDFLSPSQKNSIGGAIDAKIEITNAVAKDKTAKGIYKHMKREYPNFTMEHAKQVEEIVKEIQESATGYFEAKPQRLVSVNEVMAAVVPSNASKEIVDALKSNGIEVVTYKKGDEEARKRVVKRVSSSLDIRFRDGGRFFQGLSNDEIFEALNEHTQYYGGGPSRLMQALEEYYKGEIVSASHNAGIAMSEGLVPVPDKKYAGIEEEYHHIEFRGEDGETFVEAVPFVKAEDVEKIYGIQFREGEGAISDRDVSYENDPIAKFQGKPRYYGKKAAAFAERERRRMENAAKEASGMLGIEAEIVTDASTLQGRKAKAKGWYDIINKKVVVVVPNHVSMGDAVRTVLHEGVAHHGLRELFGDGFDAMLDNVYNNVSPELKARIDAIAERTGVSTSVATEEYLASLAETTNFEEAQRRGWWQQIKRFFVDMLNKLAMPGLKIEEEITDNELRYLLWRSYKNLVEPNSYLKPLGYAEDVVKQKELKVGEYAEKAPATPMAEDTSEAEEWAAVTMQRIEELEAQAAQLENEIAEMETDRDADDASRYEMLEQQLEPLRKQMEDVYAELEGLYSLEAEAEEMSMASEDAIRYRLVDDPAEIERLESEPTIKAYRAMQVINGELYPPMSAVMDGKLREPIALGQWEQSEERPDLADDKGRFKLDKGNKKSLKAAYNPYFHSSSTPLNDQFSEAQDRDNLVTVEVEIPVSEADGTSGYKAEKAKDAVGTHQWKAGIIQGQLTGTREVFLTRWDKPIRIVPESEVADVIVEMFDGKDIVMPSNVVTPQLRKELEARGIAFVETDNQGKLVEGEHKGKHYSKVYGKKADGLRYREGDDTKLMDALADAYASGDAAAIQDAVNDIMNAIRLDDADPSIGNLDWEKVENYNGTDPRLLAAQYIVRAQHHLYLDEDYDTEYIKTGIKTVDAPVNEIAEEDVSNYTNDIKNEQKEAQRQFEERVERSQNNSAKGVWLWNGLMSVEEIQERHQSLIDEFENLLSTHQFDKAADKLGEIRAWQNAAKRHIDNPYSETPYVGEDILIAEIERESAALGVPVRIARSVDELPDDAETRKRAEDGSLKGVYSTRDGVVVVYLPNTENTNDAKRTILHEIVGHKGLRQLIGEKRYDKAMLQLMYMLPSDVRDAVLRRAERHGWNAAIAMDEYLADQAERDVQPTWWGKVNAKIRALLRNMGFNVMLTDADVTYLLWRSRKKLQGDSLNDMAVNAILKQAARKSAEAEAWNEQAFKDAEMRDFERNALPSIRHRMGADTNDYDKAVRTLGFKQAESWQDSMRSLLVFQQALAKASGKDISDFENAYMYENRMSSANLMEMEQYRHMVYNPLLKEIHEMEQMGASRESIINYLFAKSGLERNEVFARRDAKKHAEGDVAKEQQLYDKYRQKDYAGLTALTSGDAQVAALVDDHSKKKTEYERLEQNKKRGVAVSDADLKAAKKEMNDARKAMITAIEAEAQRMVDEFEAQHNTDNLWDKIRNCTHTTLNISHDAGVMSDEVYNELWNQFQYYIPLKGFAETTAEDVYLYLGGNDSPYNAPIKTAYGRTSLADDPIATIGNMAESAIVEANRNRLKQRFLYMVERHNTDLASISDVWLEYDEKNDEWNAVFARIPDDATPSEAKRLQQEFEDRMKLLAEQNPGKYANARQQPNIPYRVVKKGDRQEHHVIVKRNGKDVVITINGNPRVAQAINGLTNPEQNQGIITRITSWINRNLSANFTMRNPAFMVSNFVRDGFYTNSMVWVKENPAYARQYNKNWAICTAQIASLVKRYKRYEKGDTSALDMNNDMDRMFYEFMINGGETGYTVIKSVEDYKGLISGEMKKMEAGAMGTARRVADTVGNVVDTFGRWAEDTSRFAAYMTSRQLGRTITKSIWDAKEISVNFNKKGSGNRMMGKFEQGNRLNYVLSNMSQLGRNLYVFWNAGVQGFNNFKKAAKDSPAKFTAMAGTYFTLGVIVAAAFSGDDDEDDYYNLPEYVRRNNICFKIGKGKYATLPLPIEIRAIYGLGELAYSYLSGREGLTHGEAVTKTIQQMTQVLPIDMMADGGGAMALVPSAAKPVVEVIHNVDWTGRPIYKEKTPWNQNDPTWTLAFKSTSPELVQMSRLANEWTNKNTADGLERPYNRGWADNRYLNNPAVWEHIAEGYLGGVATMFNQTKKTLMMPFNEDLREVRNVPIVSRFVKDAGKEGRSYAARNEYYDAKNTMDSWKNEMSKAKKEVLDESLTDEQRLKAAKLRSSLEQQYMEAAERWKVLDRQRKALEEAYKSDQSDENRQALDDVMMQMATLVEAFRD